MSTQEQQPGNVPEHIQQKTDERSQQQAHPLIEYGPEAMLLLDAEGKITFANPAMASLIGYRAEELIGKQVFILIHPADAEETRGHLAKIASAALVIHSFEHRMSHKNGSWRWLEAHASNLLDHPDIGAIVCTYRDGSHHRELRRLQNEAF